MISLKTASPVLFAAVAAALPVAAQAEGPHVVRFSAAALNDSVAPGYRGDAVDVRADLSAIRSFTVSYTAGVTGRVPRSTRPMRAIAYAIASGPSGSIRHTGFLILPAHPSSAQRAVVMTGDTLKTVHATFTPSSRPRLRVTGLPAATHDVELTTVGRAQDLLRDTAPCRRGLRRDSNIIVAVLSDGVRRVTHHDVVSCAKLPPRG